MTRRPKLRLCFIGFLTFHLLLDGVAFAELGGAQSPIHRFSNWKSDSAGAPRLDAELDAILFPLNTVHGQFRLVRCRITNASKSPISFSAEKDLVEATVSGGKKVSAQLNPSVRAPELWNQLDLELRKRLVYPKAVAPEHAIHVYLFFPADQLTDVPSRFTWTIESLGEPIEILPPPAVKK